MKKITIFLSLALLTSSLFSQIIIKEADCNNAYNDGDTVLVTADEEFYFSIYNASDSSITYQVVVTDATFPAGSEWLDFCVAGSCSWLLPTDELPKIFPSENTQVNLAPETCDSEPHIIYHSGTAVDDFIVKIKFEHTYVPEDTVVLFFKYDYSLADINSVHKNNGISISPNPASSQVFVTYDVENSEYVELYDIKGNLIQQFSVNSDRGDFYMNTMYLPEGIYLIKIGNASKKLAIKH